MKTIDFSFEIIYTMFYHIIIHRKAGSYMGDFSILAARIKELRSSLNITQKEFATFVGCTAATLSSYENGSKSPSLEIIKGIAEKCEVSIDWLCGLSDKKKITNESIRTYADVMRICESHENSISALNNITEKFNKVMNEFIAELKHMKSLEKNRIIDHELYEMWLEKTLKKYDNPLIMYYGETIYNPFEINSDIKNNSILN